MHKRKMCIQVRQQNGLLILRSKNFEQNLILNFS